MSPIRKIMSLAFVGVLSASVSSFAEGLSDDDWMKEREKRMEEMNKLGIHGDGTSRVSLMPGFEFMDGEKDWAYTGILAVHGDSAEALWKAMSKVEVTPDVDGLADMYGKDISLHMLENKRGRHYYCYNNVELKDGGKPTKNEDGSLKRKRICFAMVQDGKDGSLQDENEKPFDFDVKVRNAFLKAPEVMKAAGQIIHNYKKVQTKLLAIDGECVFGCGTRYLVTQTFWQSRDDEDSENNPKMESLIGLVEKQKDGSAQFIKLIDAK